MADVTARGVRFHVQRMAPARRTSGPEHPVVFIHGLFVDNLSSLYYSLANPVAKAGAAVILYDLRGHGLSERTITHYGITNSVADLAAVLEVLGVEGPVHLVGNSYGGTIALGFAVTYPERVASMVLIEAHVPVPGWTEQMVTTITNIGLNAAAGDFGRWIAQHRKDARMASRIRDMITHTSVVADISAIAPLPENALRALTCPVRAVYGEHSDVLHHAHILDGLLSRFTLTVLPDVDHWVLPKATRALRDIVVEWFTAHAPVHAR
ncbi:MAG TPA: alpha/beta hydrolase [Pseudonocardiaceae bacterium]|nr:alpha/beta hydrolase [Pseudonocardiaceae bacterium]